MIIALLRLCLTLWIFGLIVLSLSVLERRVRDIAGALIGRLARVATTGADGGDLGR